MDGDIPPRLLECASSDSLFPNSFLQLSAKTVESIEKWLPSFRNVGRILGFREINGTDASIEETQFSVLSTWADGLQTAAGALNRILNDVLTHLRPGKRKGIRGLAQDIVLIDALEECRNAISEEQQQIGALVGGYWEDLETAWDGVLAALDWIDELETALAGVPASAEIITISQGGHDAAPSPEDLVGGINEFETAIVDIASGFQLEASDSVFRRHQEREDDRTFDELSVRQDPIVEMPFDKLKALLRQMESCVDEVRDWIDFGLLHMDFDRLGLEGLHSTLIAQPDLRRESLAQVAKQALLCHWVEWLYSEDEALERFRGQDHDQLVREFRQLDVTLRDQGHIRVIERAEENKPKGLASGESAILMREAHKKRRHLPLRKLFAEIPNLLFLVKPCLLMSPLSVSQYLAPDSIHFDLVIFDEASQIRPHEGIAAIYRGSQLVVCGDTKQLPPTPFFEYELAEDYYDEEDEDTAPDEFESLLDQCLSIGLAELGLNWHYRSQHEDLIAFSNHQFYADKLITFPCANEAKGLGVDHCLVEDGVYDRGGKKHNLREAELAVDLAVRTLQDNPDTSVGIVSLSVPQMNAIEAHLEARLRDEPELRPLFTTDLLEGFFTKNLENVQGDERDVIILSIGYGKDSSGRMTMNFGPLNRTGGEKRLNVAITRARKRVYWVFR